MRLLFIIGLIGTVIFILLKGKIEKDMGKTRIREEEENKNSEKIQMNWGKSINEKKDFYDDKDIVLEAIRQDGSALKHANKRFKDDKDIVFEAVKKQWF